MFLYALHDAVDDLRTFAFSNKLQDVSALLETQSLDEAMALILKLVGNGATDYGQVLARSARPALGPYRSSHYSDRAWRRAQQRRQPAVVPVHHASRAS